MYLTKSFAEVVRVLSFVKHVVLNCLSLGNYSSNSALNYIQNKLLRARLLKFEPKPATELCCSSLSPTDNSVSSDIHRPQLTKIQKQKKKR